MATGTEAASGAGRPLVFRGLKDRLFLLAQAQVSSAGMAMGLALDVHPRAHWQHSTVTDRPTVVRYAADDRWIVFVTMADNSWG